MLLFCRDESPKLIAERGERLFEFPVRMPPCAGAKKQFPL